MNYYISDLHFGHANVIKFDNRPFETVEEMDRVMIENWNARVRDEDHVYIVGDLIFRSGQAPEWYLKQLKGHKHLVIGNHDHRWMKNISEEKLEKYFDDVQPMMFIVDQGNEIHLCHFPIAEWAKFHRGAYHIYGHIHNRTDEAYQFMKRYDNALNAAASINNYMPVTLQELVMNNRIFKEMNE